MKISSTAKYALGVTAAAAMLAGCSSGASSLAPTTPTMGAQARGTAGTNFTAQVGIKGITVDAHPVTPDAKKAGQLLYVTDYGANEVDTFAWPKPKSVTGTLTDGVNQPQGACADTKGDVYIANTGDSNILEYKGSKVVNTLSDAGQFPVGCAVDAAGDVAATNILTSADGPGSVTIYAKGKGTGKNVSVTGFSEVFFGAYDKASNLWVDGEASSVASVAEVTKKGKVVNGTLTGGTFGFPGGVEFDGKDITINDQDAATVYQLSKFKIIGSTPLTGAADVDQDYIDIPTKLLIAPDAGAAQVEIYKYPKGGTASQVLTGFSQPIGAAVSAK